MADNRQKFPPGPPHGPCGPWPSVFPYDKDYPGDHPHRPPQPVPGNMWWNDTEPVMGVYPWEKCCDSGEYDPCVCISSGEVDLWNQTYSAVSGHSGDWDRAVDDSWKYSADNWESSYETVSANSAFWDSAYKIASLWDSGSSESVYDILSATSAFLSTYSASPYLNVNSAYFKGNGSPDKPLDLSEIYKTYWGWMSDAMNDLYSGGKWGESGSRSWLSEERGDYLMAWIEYLDQLMWKPGPDPNDPDYYLNGGEPRSNVGGIFYQLEKLWHVVRGEKEDDWKVLEENSASWNASRDAVLSTSGEWDLGYSGYQYISENSGRYETTVERVNDLSSASGVWNSAYDVLDTYSASWIASNSALDENSGSWNETRDFVSANSGSWSSGTHESYEYAPSMTLDNYQEFNEPSTIYYTTYAEP